MSLTEQHNLGALTLREIGELVGGANSPQNIKHHLNQLAKRGLIKIDKKNEKIERIRAGENEGSSLISIPILGSANCGIATQFANENPEGYLKVSPKVLGDKLIQKTKDLFALRAIGASMNRAEIQGESIDDGDLVIVMNSQEPQNGDYVVSIIEGCANIKQFFHDKKKKQIMLVSKSSLEIPPIYIHEEDYQEYQVSGVVVLVMKNPDAEDWEEWMQASADDTFGSLGPITKEEYDYYMSLPDKKGLNRDRVKFISFNGIQQSVTNSKKLDLVW
ncbi:MAG: LexA family protein [Candidatus Altimarinota bacterium]